MVSFTSVSVGAVVAILALTQPCQAGAVVGAVAKVGLSVAANAIGNHHKRDAVTELSAYPECLASIKGGAKVVLTGTTLNVNGVSDKCILEVKSYKGLASEKDKKHGTVHITGKNFKIVDLPPASVKYLKQAAPAKPAAPAAGAKAAAPAGAKKQN